MTDSIRKHIKYTIIHLRALGLYANSKNFFQEKLYLLYSILINGVIVGLFGLLQVLYVTTNFQNVQYLLTHSYLTLAFALCNIKAYLYLRNWPRIKRLLDQLDDVDFQPANQRQARIFDDFFWRYRFIHNLYLYMSSVVVVLWPLVRILGESKTLLFPYWLPFDHDNPILFEILYWHQSFGLVFYLLMNISLDMITLGFTSYISTECDLLSNILVNMYKVTEERLEKEGLLEVGLSEKERHEMIIDGSKDTLMYCIKLHWKIIRFSNETNSIFTVLVFMQFGSSLLSLCLTMYGLTAAAASVPEMGINLIFMAGLLVELLFFCHFGHEVMVRSSDVGTALYMTPWVDCSKAFKDNLRFFMLRTKTPIKILALNFFELALPTYVWILRCSWSFYVVLSRTTDK